MHCGARRRGGGGAARAAAGAGVARSGLLQARLRWRAACGNLRLSFLEAVPRAQNFSMIASQQQGQFTEASRLQPSAVAKWMPTSALSEGLVGQPQQPQQPQQPPPPLPQQEQPPMSAPPATERVGLVDDSVEAAPPPTAAAEPVVPTAVAVPMLTGQAAEAPMAAGVTAAGQQEPAAGLHWTVLPPLPTPKYSAMNQQSAIGCATVIGIVFACVSATHVAVALGELSDPLPTVFVTAIWAEAIIAMTCLLGLMFGDPGVIKRCEERCTPVPPGLIRNTLVRLSPLRSHRRCLPPQSPRLPCADYTPGLCSWQDRRSSPRTSRRTTPTRDAARTACAASCGAARTRGLTTAPPASAASTTSTTTAASLGAASLGGASGATWVTSKSSSRWAHVAP